MGGSATRPVAVSSAKVILRAVLAAFCISGFVFLPISAHAEEAQEATTLLILASGQYQGVWQDENGESNALLADFKIDDLSIKGDLTLIGVEDYSGDKIRGKIEQNDDGTLSIEIKTRDGFWRGKANFDGQLLVGTYTYKFMDRRVRRLLKGEWAAQRAGD